MSQFDLLPAWFSKVNKRFRTPARAVLVFGGIALLQTIIAFFTPGEPGKSAAIDLLADLYAFGATTGYLLVFISLGLIAFRALGLVIASVANTMQEGTILVQLFYFPMLLLSGATFPSEKFPRVMQIIHNFVPATYLVQGMKNIMLKGQSLTEKDNPLAVLVMLLTIVGGGLISMKLFRWEKEEKIRGSAKLWVLAVLAPFFAMGVWKWFHT